MGATFVDFAVEEFRGRDSSMVLALHSRQTGEVETAISLPTRRAMITLLACSGLTIIHPASLLALDNIGGMKMQHSPAVKVALAHIEAWSHHDWDKTKELLAPDVHASVTTTMPNFGGSEFTGIDKYMALKVKAAQLIKPGSVQVIGAIGDERNALTLVTFSIGLGPGGAMVTMARACLYMLDENSKIKEERDSFFVLSSK
jgi:SnoaL-like domain